MKRHDEMSDAIAEVFLEAHSEDHEYIGIIPTREKGTGQGEGIPCRYGMSCKRRDCWFMHPKIEIPTGDLVRKEEDDDVSSNYIVDHCIESANHEPKSGRVEQDDGTYKSLNMSIGKKKLHAKGPEGLAQMMYGTMIINGVQYCRRHLILSCHLCRAEYTPLKHEVDDERERLGLRCGGDPMLNERAEKWGEYIQGKNMQKTLQRDMLIQRYGTNHAQTHPQHWTQLTTEWNAEEREINDRFLPEVDSVKNQGVTQCCYWACKTPNGLGEEKKLLKCTGCGIAKYCCKEHQLLDWKWEHKGECTVNVPDWLNEEMEQDHLRNLNGDYSEHKW